MALPGPVPSPVARPYVAVDDLGAFLEGSWAVSRVVEDRRLDTRFFFEGLATFTRAGSEELDYVERGVLFGAARCDTAERRLSYRLVAPGRASVRFEDGRFFHDLDLARGRDVVAHDCPPDRYTGVFAVRGAQLVVSWRVVGPDTSYVSRSRFTPV